ncbi:hypothetical protein EYF80_025408 [Liparis tanakae]|uniref:Uncharacterized protein n=1 Tax=Liparis tanakae TaxID=230148 RepID=A0A4Z2HES5_9TELE|nr:hypothetical protein EYF80_025408 [Liparis tanakae]
MRHDVAKPIGSWLSNFKGAFYSAMSCGFSSNLKATSPPPQSPPSSDSFLHHRRCLDSGGDSAGSGLVHPGSGQSPMAKKTMHDSIQLPL